MPILSVTEGEEQAEPEKPVSTLNGAGLRALREDFGWSRKTLSDTCGLTISAIATIEVGRRPPTDRERRLITEVLLNTLEETLDAPKPVSLIKGLPEGTTRVGEWNGIRRGDPVKVRGIKGTFRFLYLHRDETQEYLEVFGPVFTASKNPHAPARRSFETDRVTKVK
jgi:transcriptional regulator with XRE-family HTH domain